jgi:hypothetical protein
MKNYFTAVLLCLLSAFTGCEMPESIVPQPGPEDADATGTKWVCIMYSVESVDTIQKGSYLGFTIGQEAGSSYTVMQNLWQQTNIQGWAPFSIVTADLAQFEKTLPLYNSIYLRRGEYPSPAVYISLEKGKVTDIGGNDQPSLSRWPISEPAALTIRIGDAAETIYPKLLALKDKPAYADYFNSLLLSQHDISLGYDPVMASLREWNVNVPTGEGKADGLHLQFEQGALSTIIVRHMTY